MPTALITGGAGFIGSHLVRLLAKSHDHVVVLDAATYAASPDTLAELEALPECDVVRGQIQDRALIDTLLERHRPDVVFNLAAESHVDRSIDTPDDFIATNIMGVFTLLEATRKAVSNLPEGFRFVQISTDEVYGSIEEGAFTEASPYRPNSPYSASKASADHLVRAYHRTYDLPLLMTNCSNNYGPYQFPEKLIPLTILNAISGEPLRVYGDGMQMRDWIHVSDHCAALALVAKNGTPGETYMVGADHCIPNIEIVHTLCDILDQTRPRADGASYREQIAFVSDRPGHDRRYAVDSGKIRDRLGWRPAMTFEEGLRDTVDWYLSREDWWEPLRAGKYAGQRLGAGQPAQNAKNR